MQIDKIIGFLIHDIIAHPICGFLWIFRFQKLGDWLHDKTVFKCNLFDEVWSISEERLGSYWD